MSVSRDPSADEIKPYVAIGFGKDYSFTVQKNTFDTGFILFLVFFVLGLILILVLTLYYANEKSKLPSPPPPLPLASNTTTVTIHSNYGASNFSIKSNNLDGSDFTTESDCNNHVNTKWTGTTCICQFGYFGTSCNRNSHDSNYFAVGVPNESMLGINVLEQLTSDGKSLNDNDGSDSCSDHCNNTETCIGFIYQDLNRCTLLSDDVVVPAGSSISYSLSVDSVLYLKSSDNLHFEGRIFLAEYIYSFPTRYWLVHKSQGYLQLPLNTISSLDFVPTIIKNYESNLTGIYTTYTFTNDDIDIILTRGTNTETYIHNVGQPLNIPRDWKYLKKLYVVYLNI